MSTIRGVYTSAAKRELKNLYANWEPSRPIALGDYGVLSGAWFDRLGSIQEFGVDWEERPRGDGLSRHNFTSSDSVDIEVRAGGQAPGARAGLEIRFGRANSVYMDAAGCAYRAIESKRLLGNRLEATADFDRRWVVVTDLLLAKRTIVAISSGSNASIEFEAAGTVSDVDLFNGDAALSAGRRTSIGYVVDAERDLTPLFGLCGFQRRFLSSDSMFKTLSRALADAEEPDSNDPSEVEFAQLT